MVPYKDREKQREAQRRNYLANKERVNERTRQWRKANPDKMREYRERDRARKRGMNLEEYRATKEERMREGTLRGARKTLCVRRGGRRR